MKIKVLLFNMLGFFMLNSLYAQNVPNGSFESWEMRYLYEEPVSWITANQEAFMHRVFTVSKTTDSYSGIYALRLESVALAEDTLFGYAFSDGRMTGGEVQDTLEFIGGFPVTASPDSLFAHLKYEMAPEDTGLVLVSFKKNGIYLGQNVFYLTGTKNSYAKMAWEIEALPDTPDTAIVAFASSNPDHIRVGGYLQVDSIWFGNLPGVIPNADFENWHEESYQEPVNWVTTNLFAQLYGGDMSATPSVDAHSGSFALRIEAVETLVPSESGLTNMVTGFAMAFENVFVFGEDLPKFPIGFNPSVLEGYYKLEPFLNDTAIIYAALYDDEGGEYASAMYLLPNNEYTLFELPLNYPEGVTITEISIVTSTTIYLMQTGEHSGEIGTVLYLDDLHLIDPCEMPGPYSLIPNYPTCDDNSAMLDAGDGWDEYLWSTGATTQTIVVTIDEALTIGVTVTDTVTGCQYSDDIELSPPTGCEDLSDSRITKEISVEIYPNPTSGIFSIELYNVVSGTYNVDILDVTGKSLIRKDINIRQNDGKVQMDMSPYPEGLYLLKISGNGFARCERILIR